MTPWTPEYHLMGRVAALRLIGGGGFPEGSPPDPEPPPPTPPPGSTIVGYGAGTTGGGASPTVTVNSSAPGAYTALRTALLASGSRYIKIIGNGIIDGLGATLTITNGNLTIDGSEWFRSTKRLHLKIRASNVLVRYMRLRPGDQMTAPDDVDGLTVNPGSGSGDFVDNIAIDHCSILWGPDVGGLTFLNGVRNATVQYSILGAGLYLSAHFEATPAKNGHSKGASVTTIGQAVEHGTNQTWYRNFITTASDRNPHIMGVDGMDYVNNVLYNWEKFTARGNPRGLNYVGNVVKKGPDTTNHEAVFMSGTNQTDNVIHPNSVWLGHATNPGGNNFAIGFTLDDELTGSARRTSAYGSLSVTAATADAALGAAVVAGAGCFVDGAVDSIDAGLKTHYTNGTSDGLYNGAGEAAPNPSWP